MPKLSDLTKKKGITPESIPITPIESKTVKKEIIKEKPSAKKIDFNNIPSEIVKYPFDKAYNPTIIRVFDAYENIAGKSAPRTPGMGKIQTLKALVYISLQLIHRYENGELSLR